MKYIFLNKPQVTMLSNQGYICKCGKIPKAKNTVTGKFLCRECYLKEMKEQ